MQTTWSVLKSFATSRSLSIQWVDLGTQYWMAAYDGPFNMECILNKDGGSDQIDFENNFKSAGNQTFSDSSGIPITRTRAFTNTDGFYFVGQGFSGVIPKNTTGTIDYKITQNLWLNGAQAIVKNGIWGDTCSFEVVDKDNILGYGSNVVINEFVSNWSIIEDQQDQGLVILPYAAMLPANLYIRVVYVSTGSTNDVQFALNLFVHAKK